MLDVGRKLAVGLRELARDLETDVSTIGSPPPSRSLIWCAGVPKSGTTRIRKVFHETPYVEANTSRLRRPPSDPRLHEHDMPIEFVAHYAASRRRTFARTHSHLVKSTVEFALSRNVGVIVSVRDLRDVMISRYRHILADPRHWAHSEMSRFPDIEGFLHSLNYAASPGGQTPLDYYYNWISYWVTFAKSHPQILLMQYEDFNKYPLESAQAILRLAHCDSRTDPRAVLDAIESDRVRAVEAGLEGALSLHGRTRSTFREGRTGSWQTFMDSGSLREFERLLPGPSEDVYYLGMS